MKTKLFFLWIVAGLMAMTTTLFVACKEDEQTDDPVTPSLTVNPKTIAGAPAAGGTAALAVTANVAWKVAVTPTDATWCTLDKSGAPGNASVNVTIAENTATADRAATITFTANGASAVLVPVTQAAATVTVDDDAILEASLATIPAPAAGIDTAVLVTANVAWTATVPEADAWITLTGSSATANGTLTVAIAENPAGAPARASTITLSATGAASVLIAVTQEAGEAIIDENAVLTASLATIPAPAAGISTEVLVTANVAWTAAVPEADAWITLTDGSATENGTFTVAIAENPLGSPARASTITLSATGAASVLIAVTQAGAAVVLTLTPATFDVPATAALNEVIATLTLNSNIPAHFVVGSWGEMPTWSYRAYTSNDNSTSGDLFDGTPATIPAGDGQSIYIKARTGSGYVNNTWNSRSSTIIIEGAAPYQAYSDTITFTQLAPDRTPELNATGVSTANVAAAGGNATINVTGNEDWTAAVTTGSEWITITSGSPGAGIGTVALTIAENTVEAPRAGIVTITGSHGATPVNIEITQVAAPAAGDKIIFTSNTAISAEPAIATALDSKTQYTITFNAAEAWTAAVVNGAAGWLSIDPASGAAGDGQSVVVTVNYFKGSNTNISKVRFTSGGNDYDVTITDNYANAVVTAAGQSWAPTDVLDPGQFVPVIKLRGKAYQWNRNIGYTVPEGLEANVAIPLPDGMDAWPGKGSFEYKEVTYIGYTSGQSWSDTPCPAGWSMPDITLINTLLPNGTGALNTEDVKTWTNTSCPGLFFPAAGEIKNNGTFDKPGSGNPRYGMWGTNENNADQGKRRRMDSNNTENFDKHAAVYVRCYK
jgi:hypothetical protein